MTSQESDTSIVDPSKEVEVMDVKAMREEMYKLRHQMAEMHQAWVKGQSALVYPANPAYVPPLAQSQELPTVNSSPSFPFYQQSYDTTSYPPQAPPPKQNPPPPITPVFVAPPPATLQRSSSEPLFPTHDSQYYPPEPTFKAPEPYSYTPHLELPAETDKPLKDPEQEEMFRKVKSLEQSFRNMQELGGQVSVAYKDFCLFPDVQLPVGFKLPKFDLYDGHGDHVAHLRGFCSKMRGAGGRDELLMAYFSQSLSGAALEWYTRQDHARWYTWDDLAQAFACHIQYNLEIVPDRLSLTKMEKKPGESFREYGFRWREKAARVDPPMKETEMVDYFLQALEPTYYGHLVSAVGKSFNEVVKMGSMVEEGLKSDKIMSYAAIKATTQAIQSGTGGVLGKKQKEDVAVVDSRTWSRGPSPYYHQPRPRPQTYSHTPQHYYLPRVPHFSVHHAHTYPQHPAHAQWRAPTPQNTFPTQNTYRPPRAYKTPLGAGLRASQNFKQERAQKQETFTPIGESYEDLFEKLKHYNLIAPVPPNHVDKRARSFDPSKRCEYHSNAQGHDIESCRDLKREIERIIQEGVIAVQDSATQNITQNPLPAHDGAHFVGKIHGDREYENPLGNSLNEVNDIEISEGPSNFDGQSSG